MNELLDYQGKVCVVTGSSSGMGKATAEELIKLGAKVYGIDYVKSELPGAEKVIDANLANKDEIDEAFDNLPKNIDCFFGIAGVSGQHHDYNTTIKINSIANMYIVKQFLKDRMNENGAIAFVSSLAALWWENHVQETAPFFEVDGWDEMVEKVIELDLNDTHGTNAYFISKRLVNHLVSEMAPYFMTKNVRINAIMPAAATTGLTADFADMMGGEDKLVTGLIKRPATSLEMAYPLLFLNSQMASYITGVCIPLDAGESSQQMINKKPREYDFDVFGG